MTVRGEVGARAEEGVNGENGEENLVLSGPPDRQKRGMRKWAVFLFLLLSVTHFPSPSRLCKNVILK